MPTATGKGGSDDDNQDCGVIKLRERITQKTLFGTGVTKIRWVTMYNAGPEDTDPLTEQFVNRVMNGGGLVKVDFGIVHPRLTKVVVGGRTFTTLIHKSPVEIVARGVDPSNNSLLYSTADAFVYVRKTDSWCAVYVT